MKVIKIKSYKTTNTLLTSIVLLILGILLFTNPSGMTRVLSYIIGGTFLVLGISKIIFDSKNSTSTSTDQYFNIVMILIGLIFIIFSNAFELLVRLVMGIWILLSGLSIIASGANTMKATKGSIVSLIIGFILILVGIYMIFVDNLVFSTIGLILIIYSVLSIVDYLLNKGA